MRWLRYTAVLVHASSALLTIGLFLIHVYMGVFAERGAFGSVIRGDVTIEFARRYHPGWYKEIVGSSPPLLANDVGTNRRPDYDARIRRAQHLRPIFIPSPRGPDLLPASRRNFKNASTCSLAQPAGTSTPHQHQPPISARISISPSSCSYFPELLSAPPNRRPCIP